MHTTVYKTGKNQDLLYSTENYSQHLVIVYNGKEPEKEYMYVCVCVCVCVCDRITLLDT